ncbi:GcvT family protein [Roseovarius sp. 2305UL8-3]|uniref:GcvT family protein n=1 Tax=Roseovarius conchicola TaxID=3121636 RepID=UPI00352849E1
MSTLPNKARVVIVGGGVIGCSVAYHLAKLGWKDIVLLERKQLTCGTTWHAAGLIGQLRASSTMTKLAKYTTDLYHNLEAETGISTGIKANGSISVALTEDRKEELYRSAAMARAFDVDVEEISPEDAKKMYPHLNIGDVTGAVYLPNDGQGDPANVALALAKGARMEKALIRENVKVTAISKANGRVTGVDWAAGEETGHIESDYVVNCAGMWGHEVGRMAGVNVPLHACEHFYIVTEAIPELTELPVLRVPDECAYYKEDAGKILLGCFEPNAKPWGMNGISEDFCFDQLPEDFDHFEPILEMAVNRMPMLAETGIHTFFNGPESFTPDDAYHLGEAPELRNYFVAAGFNSIGIQSAGGAGKALAEWMETGEKTMDLGGVDISRMQPFQGNKHYLFERSKETLGLLYADHYPYRQKATARGVRRSPFHNLLDQNGAVYGESAGWERANWFANEGQAREYQYTWKRQNWFENSAAEHRAARENVGMYDMSSFGKLRIEGRDAETLVNLVCGANMSVPVGKIVYTQMLNSKGGIEADVTVTRLSETAYLMVTPSGTRLADQTRLQRHVGDLRVVITDVTAGEGVLAVMGPNARTLLEKVSPNDFSNAVNPFGTAQEIEIGMGLARAHRVTYVGELGWEIYTSSDMAEHVFETLWDAGREMDLKLCGMHMMDSCRIEKGFRHFGHDITSEDHVVDAGLSFAADLNKDDFIGKAAVAARKESGPQNRMVQFLLNDPEPLLYHNEPIIRDGEYVGYLSSGNYGHTLGGAVGMGYVPCAGESAADVLGSSYEIDVCGVKVKAEASLKPMYDPKAERVKV